MATSPKSRGLGNISPIVNRSKITSPVKPVAKMPVPKPVTTTFAQRQAAPSPFRNNTKQPMAKVNPLQQAMQPQPRTDIPRGAQMRTPVERPKLITDPMQPAPQPFNPNPTPGPIQNTNNPNNYFLPIGEVNMMPAPQPFNLNPDDNQWGSSYDKLRNSSVYEDYRRGNQSLMDLTRDYQQKYGLPGGTFEGLRANGKMTTEQQAALDADPRYQELKKYSPGLFQRYLGSIDAGDNADIQRFQQAEKQRQAGLDPRTGLPPGVKISLFGGYDMESPRGPDGRYLYEDPNTPPPMDPGMGGPNIVTDHIETHFPMNSYMDPNQMTSDYDQLEGSAFNTNPSMGGSLFGGGGFAGK